MIGQRLNNRYTILSLLGEGGMGEVYLAEDEQTKGQVAVKILARQLTAHPESLERFRREAKTLRQLDHPNIVKFVDAFEYESQYVIVMEYMQGGSLHDLLKQGQLPIERAREIALGLCDALIRSHQLNIIHRDIKPENVLLNEEGIPKLADFGVARLSEGTRMTRSGTQVGTPYYMSPEAWEGKQLDAQADVWSLGALLFEMLSGQIPFSGDTPLTVMNKIFTSELPDLKNLRKDAPNDLLQIVKRMLAKDISKRYKTMRQVAVDLESGEQVIKQKPVKPSSKPTRIVEPRPKINFSHYRNIFIIGILVIGLIFAINLIPSNPTNTVIPSTATTEATETNTSNLVSEKDGMTLVYVPAGEFIMGSDDGELDEQPIHQVALDAFWIDKTEVSNLMYSKCVDDNQCNPPSNSSSYTHSAYFGISEFDNFPVIYVSWDDAKAYCEWAGRRLPSEAEWEKAARGTNGSIYPWGDVEPTDILLNFNGNIGDTSVVGNYPEGVSIYGALDMGGNVWEWVSSLYQSYPYDANDGREVLTSSDSRILRGGSWNFVNTYVRSAFRSGNIPTFSDYDIGFRCALSETTSSSNEQATQTVDEIISPTPELGIGSTMVSEKDDIVMVYVPDGTFTMGSDSGYGNERPTHNVFLDAFWIDRTEISHRQFAECVKAGACGYPLYVGGYARDYFFEDKYADYPIKLVSWEIANSYCEWVGRRLPTEAEWEKAARGTDERIYPWGNENPNCSLSNIPDCTSLNTSLSPLYYLSPVGSYPDGESPYGALDMIGNVQEWVADWYDETYYSISPSNNPLGLDSGDYRVARGGSVQQIANAIFRIFALPDYKFYRSGFSSDIGFRCALTETTSTTTTNISTTATASGSTTVSENDGMTSVFVPSGEFIMGIDIDDALTECQKFDTSCTESWFADKAPGHTITLGDYYIDQTEVTNAMYAKCVEDGVCQEPIAKNSSTHPSYFGNPEFDEYPVIHVDWNMAKMYCEWAGRRLPTEAEWEKAARGVDGGLYPWGDIFDGTIVNFCDSNCSYDWANQAFNDGFEDVAPVGNYPAGQSIYGVYDMSGNIWEWTSSIYQSYPYDANDGREDLNSSANRVFRGSSWYDSAGFYVRPATSRLNTAPATNSYDLGFRCARSP